MPEPWTTERPKILVIADDQGAGELLARLIDRAGWTTDLAFSPAAGLDELEGAVPPYAALVIDLATTAQSIDVLKAVRAEESTAAARVLICARSAREQDEAWITGTDGFLVHPFESEALVTEVEAVVGRPHDDREVHRRERIAGSIPDAPA